MKSMRELVESRHKLMTELRGILTLAQSENRGLTSGERERYNALDAQVDLAIIDIREAKENSGERYPPGALDQMSANLRSLSPESDDIPLPRPIPGPLGGRRDRLSDVDLGVAGWFRSLNGVQVPRDEARACERLGFALNSPTIVLPIPGCSRTLGRDLSFGGAENLSQFVGNDIKGGYTVPMGFMYRFEKALKATAPMLMTSEIIITKDGREMPWPTLDDTSSEGFEVGEREDAGDADDMSFGSHRFGAWKYGTGFLKFTHELLRDSALVLANEVATVFGERLGRIINRRATTGSGSQTILGILESATVGRTATGTSSFTMDDLIYLQHSVDPAYRQTGNVGWQMHNETAAFCRRLKDGNGVYLWQNSTIVGQPPTLLGDPVYINQNLASSLVASAKPVLYGALDKFKIRVVGGDGTNGEGVRFRYQAEAHAKTDEYGFGAFLEADGMLMCPSSDSSLCPVRVLQLAP